jgi:hypothetical protein
MTGDNLDAFALAFLCVEHGVRGETVETVSLF